jgi:nitrogenase molybdenum-iron protein alpha chain
MQGHWPHFLLISMKYWRQSMSINLQNPAVELREIRLGSITGYEGDAEDLYKKSKNGTVAERERTFTQCISCSANQVKNQLVSIIDAAVIEHGPAGCGGDIPGRNMVTRSGRKMRGMPVHNLHYINTNLDENDMIYGGGDKLEKAIREAKLRFNPKAIFVTTTCASAIIGDDVSGICDRLEEEIGVPLVAIFCEGFRSRIWATGFDAAYHGILRKIVKPARQKQPELINIINFQGRDVFTPLLGQIGLKPNYIVPYKSIEQLSRISEAAATIQICTTLGTYLAAGLEEHFGVPEVKAPLPYGLAGTDACLRELGRITHKEMEVEALIKKEHERIAPKLEELRGKLRGKRVFIGAGDAHGHSILAIVRELGMEIAGSCIWHHDLNIDNGSEQSDDLHHVISHYGNFPLGVCNKQSFELVNQLNRAKPDIYIARHTGTIWATKLGIPSFLMGDEHFGLGYEGLLNYGELIDDTIRNPAFVRNIAAHNRLPYTEWWLAQPPYSCMGGADS